MEETVKNYIFGYPWHLEDGTISRPYSWPSEGLIELTGQVSAFFLLQYSESQGDLLMSTEYRTVCKKQNRLKLHC